MTTLNPGYFDHGHAAFRPSGTDQATTAEADEAVDDARSVLVATLVALGLTVLGIVLAS